MEPYITLRLREQHMLLDFLQFSCELRLITRQHLGRELQFIIQLQSLAILLLQPFVLLIR